MNVLYLGDIMAEPGIQVVTEQLPKLIKQYTVDLVIAQSENVTEGRGIVPEDMERLLHAGVNFFTGGNWSPYREEIHSYLSDPLKPIIGPANLAGCPGEGWKTIQTPKGEVLIISLLGQIVGNRVPETSNPLTKIDSILSQNHDSNLAAIVVNLHGDYSSEKVIIGHYLDGKVSMVVGDHWHVPTADARVLPKGTAHITDVGMCGVLNASLGVTLESVIPRWRNGAITENVMETDGPRQVNGVVVSVDEKNRTARSIQAIRQTF